MVRGQRDSARQKRLYQCRSDGCTKEFQRRDYRDRHEQTHSLEKPYRCETCGKGYHRLDVLVRHTKLHDLVRSEGVRPIDDRVIEIQEDQGLSGSQATSLGIDGSSLHTTSPGPSTAQGELLPLQTEDQRLQRNTHEADEEFRLLLSTVSPVLTDAGYFSREPYATIRPVAGPTLSPVQSLISSEFLVFMKGISLLLGTTVQSTFHQYFLSREFLNTCLELYFIHCDSSMPIIHRPTWEQSPPSLDSHWLLLALILIGSASSMREEAYTLASLHVYPAIQSAWKTTLRDTIPSPSVRLMQAAVWLDFFGVYYGSAKDHYCALVDHSSTIESLSLAGYWHVRLAASCDLTWVEWAAHEEKKRLATFALVLDGQYCVAFGRDFRVSFRRMANCLPCNQAIWRCASDAEWQQYLTTHKLEEVVPTTAFEHLLRHPTMHHSVSGVFAASMLLVGTLASVPISSVQLQGYQDNPDIRRLKEMRGAILWSWHQAYRTSFGSADDGGLDCELFYHGGFIHHSNINTLVLRMAAGEPRVGSIQVQSWQKDHAQAELNRLYGLPAGSFSAWNAVQMLKLVLDSSREDTCIEPFPAWMLYIAVLTLYHFGAILHGRPKFTALDRLCVQQIGPNTFDIEPRLARKSTLQYLAHFEPYQNTPGDYALAARTNEVVGLLGYTIHLLQNVRWRLLEQSRTTLINLLISCER
ncbi:hypothetical protein BCR39DRAFT_543969 [Naematelia encephala]|uniref:pH-response transcription factor pacC/RIM101 n=1 Tax=Naematelia encephala TaxID=71784 RepID=A0A1Y2ATL0_9TREE|nr:hypothetical protein BCR39DRAFT_543969 [Naematelia encephala]